MSRDSRTRADRAERAAAYRAELDRTDRLIAAARREGCRPGMPRDEAVAAAVRLSGRGLSNRVIGDLLGVSKETVRLWVRDSARGERAA